MNELNAATARKSDFPPQRRGAIAMCTSTVWRFWRSDVLVGESIKTLVGIVTGQGLRRQSQLSGHGDSYSAQCRWKSPDRQVSTMPYDPKAIANYFLDLGSAQDKPLSPMKLQKLVYFANGWYLALKGTPLINEQVEAWKFGPVIPSLYGEFKCYGDQPVTEKAEHHVTERLGGFRVRYHRSVPSIDDIPDQAQFTKAFLDRIWETYGSYTAIQLSNETHREGSPWDKVYKRYNGEIPRRTDIPADDMKEYFQSLMRPATTAQ
jgi:uncharacterized phage-associated protein